jgi:hypothetical protein
MATQDDYIKTALRLPRAVHAKLLAASEQTGKSMNAEIIARLEASFEGDANLSAEDRKFLISLVGAVRSARQGRDEQPDLVIEHADGTVDFVDIKEYRKPEPPKRRITRKVPKKASDS